MKRIAIIVLALLLAAVGAYFLIPGDRQSIFKDHSLYEAVPVTFPLFFEFSSLKAIPRANPIIAEWHEAGVAKSWIDNLEAADEVIGSVEGISGGLKNAPFLCAFGYTGRNELVPLLLAKAESQSRERSFHRLIEELYPPDSHSYTEKAYGNYTITEVTSLSTGPKLFYSFGNDFFLASPASILVEEVLRQFATPGIMKDPYFREVNVAASGQDFSLFVNHAALGGLFTRIFTRSVTERTDEFNAVSRIQPLAAAGPFLRFAGWSRFGIRWQDDQITLKGHSGANDSLNHFLAVFQDQQPVRTRAEEILPRNTSWYCSYTFSGKDAFFDRLESYFTHASTYYQREERMKRFDQGFRTDVRTDFREAVRSELMVATSVIPVNSAEKTTYFLIQTAGRSAGEELLQKLMGNYAARREITPDQLTIEMSLPNGDRYTAYRFPYPSFPGLWIGTPFSVAEANFVAVYNDLMVFCNTEQGLLDYLRHRTAGTTLDKEVHARQSLLPGSARANIHLFTDVNRLFGIRTELLAPSFLTQVDHHEELVRKAATIRWQVSREKGSYLHSLAVSLRSPSADNGHALWQTALGSALRTNPFLVINHNDRSTREVIFQDQLNQVSLVSGNGHVRWTLPLQEPVLGEIHQIDVLRNGKLQYLFNTRDKLYLIDRNGNTVAPFPIRFPAPATNGVAVFDYDRNRNYRYFVAGEENRIFAYDQNGKTLTGWKFTKSNAPVTTPMQYFRVNGKDYIAVRDESTVYFLNRQGEQRIDIPEAVQLSANPLSLIGDRDPKFVGTAPDGRVHYFYPDGKHEVTGKQGFNATHFFVADDLDGNGTADFVFVDGNTLTVIDENGKRMFSKRIGNSVLSAPGIYSFTNQLKKVGVTSASDNEIYLFDPAGKLHSGFPLHGNSVFSIGKMSDSSDALNLIVGSADGMLLNYQLQE